MKDFPELTDEEIEVIVRAGVNAKSYREMIIMVEDKLREKHEQS